MKPKILLSMIATAALAACGGGESSPTETKTSTTISGTAAVGAAIAGAQVDVKCASGSGSATTAADGRFSVVIEDAVRPCVLAVPAPGGGMLHSLVEAGTGAAAVANITPLSELMVAQIAAGDTAAFFAAFDVVAQAKLTQEGVAAAREQVKLALTGLVDLSGVDPLKDALVAASDGKAGNALDQTLDALGAKLGEAQVSLAEVAAAMAANPASAAPLQTMLQPAASGCAWLKSGTYRILDLLEGSGRSDETLTLDAKALTVTHSDGTSEALADQGECHYTVAGVAAYVARSGAAIVHDPNGGERPGAPVMLIPEQTVAVSELAGTWNVFGHERGGEGEPWVPIAVTISFDASGKLTAGAECENFQVCTPWSDQNATVTPNPAGGFDLSDADGTSRLFAFKTPDGQLTLYVVGEYGFYVAARQQPQTLPAVGTERRTWDFFIGGNGIMSAPAATSRTVISVDAAAKSNTRLNQAEHRIDTWTADGFRNGISYRAANSMTIDGVVQQHAAAYSLSLPGVGISAIALPATKTFLFSASRP